MAWKEVALLVSVLSPLVGVPLTMIALYLRAIREHQTVLTAELTHRIEAMETSMRDLLRATTDFEREYTTKEEWVRESMLARQRLERLTELVARIETELENGRGLATQLGRLTAAMTEMVRTWAERDGTERGRD